MLRIIILAVLLLNSKVPFAQKVSAAKNALDANVRYGRLANGLTYYIKKNNNPADKIEMSLVVNAGWQHEDPDQLGLAHLLEHLAFNGSRHFPGDSMNKYAAKSDVLLNAETAEYTVYRITLPTADRTVYKNCLQILQDWAVDLTLDSAEIDAERGVVLSEFRSATSEMKAVKDMNAILYNHVKYPQHFYESHDRSIKTFQHPSLIRFFKDWYRPDNEAIIIVGDINVDTVEMDLKDFFDSIKNPPTERRHKDIKTEYAVHLNGENKLISQLSGEMTETSIEILWRREKEKNNPSEIETELYNLMAMDRFKTIAGPFHNLYHKIDVYGGDATTVLTQLDAVVTGVKFDRGQPVDKGIKIVLQELERIRRHGFTEGELKEAKSKLMSRLEKMINPSSADLSYKYLMHFVYNEEAPDPAKKWAQQKQDIAGIKLSDINEMIKTWLGSNNNRHILITANTEDSSLIPDERLMNSWIKESKSAKITPYQYQPPVAELISGKDIPGVADGMACGISDIAELGIRELKFQNGAKVILKPVSATGPNAGKIYLKGFSSAGANILGGSDYELAKNIPQIISQSGLNHIGSVSLNKFLQQKEMTFDFAVGDRAVSFDVRTGMANLETVLQMVYLYFTKSKPDAVAFGAWKIQDKGKQVTNDPNVYFNTIIDSLRYPGRLKEIDNNASEIRYDRWDTVFQRLLGDAGTFTFVITGNFDIEKISTLLFRYLCNLPGKLTKNDSAASDIIPAIDRIDNKVYAGGRDMEANVKLFFPSAYYPSLANDINLEFFEQALRIKMTEQLREKSGGTYSVTTSLNKYKGVNNAFSYAVEFQCDPAASQKMMDMATEEFEKLKSNGIDSVLFEMVRNQMIGLNAKNLASNLFWAQYLTDQYAHNFDRTDILKRESIIKYIITLKDLNTSLKELLNNCSHQSFVLLPKQ